MDSARYHEIEKIFAVCCDLPLAERDAYLDQACDGDAELRAAVETLLQDDDAPETFLQRARMGAAGLAASAMGGDDDDGMPASIGPYRVARRIGAGGMGIVYLAEQDQPRRSVAVKVLRPGAISAQALRRFELEAQVLGQLQHPGIAHIYEARTTGAGRERLSYFAMEYVDGLALSAHVKKHQLGTRACFELMARICDAVHHAHQKGVIHRDLKPGNILVDHSGQPKILDFGVARATDADLQTVTLQTDVGQLIGTLPYMSPEQVTGLSAAIDTRSDVYALGVIMFELLTGRLPHEVRERSIPEAARMIREEEPAALSSINPHLRGDVETIVAKALEKDKDRRYSSAAELAADIRHYLRDEPITARPASTTYQFRKFARRNRVLVGGVCATFIAVVAGLVVSLTLYFQADRARQAEKIQGQLAREEADRANAINDFLLQDMLAAPDPWSELGKDVSVATVLDTAADRIEGAFAGQPALEAQVRETLGGSYVARGLYSRGADQLQLSVDLYRRLAAGDESPTAGDRLPIALERFAEAQRLQGDLTEAESTAREALKLSELRFGSNDPRTGDALYTLGNVLRSVTKFAEAGDALQRCLDIRRHLVPPNKKSIAKATVALGGAFQNQKRQTEAERALQDARLLFTELYGTEHPYVAQIDIDLGAIDLERGEDEDAIAHLDPACRMLVGRLGESHSETLTCRRTLALAQHGAGDSETAVATLRGVLDASDRTLGKDHPDTMIAINSLAFIYLERDEPAQSIPLYTRLLSDSKNKLGDAHLETLRFASNLAWSYRKSQRLDEAEALFRETAKILLDNFGVELEDTRVIVHSLALLLHERQKWDDCFEQFRIITAACRDESNECDWRRGYYLNGFGDALIAAGAYEEATEVLAEGIAVCEEMFSPGDWRLADTRGKLGFALAQVGDAALAEDYLTETYPMVAAAPQAPPETKQAAYHRLREGLTKIGRAERVSEFEPPAAVIETE